MTENISLNEAKQDGTQLPNAARMRLEDDHDQAEEKGGVTTLTDPGHNLI
jgi:hypothetical protein